MLLLRYSWCTILILHLFAPFKRLCYLYLGQLCKIVDLIVAGEQDFVVWCRSGLPRLYNRLRGFIVIIRFRRLPRTLLIFLVTRVLSLPIKVGVGAWKLTLLFIFFDKLRGTFSFVGLFLGIFPKNFLRILIDKLEKCVKALLILARRLVETLNFLQI